MTRFMYDQAAAELGVSPDATGTEIKRAWRAAAVANHPDKGGDADVFKRKTGAWEILQQANFTRPAPPSNILDALLSSLQTRRRAPPAPKTPPVILVSFQEIMLGARRNVLIPNWEYCTLGEDTPHAPECVCSGTGWILNGETQQGFTIPPGSGFAGVRPRDTILRFRGFGAPIPASIAANGRAERGEYTLLIRWDMVRPDVVDDTFLRHDRPILRVRHSIDVTQMWLQEEISVTLPWDDEPYTIQLLPGKTVYLFPDEGIPLLPPDRGCGDLEIQVDVRPLETLSEGERTLVQALRELRVPKPTSSPT